MNTTTTEPELPGDSLNDVDAALEEAGCKRVVNGNTNSRAAQIESLTTTTPSPDSGAAVTPAISDTPRTDAIEQRRTTRELTHSEAWSALLLESRQMERALAASPQASSVAKGAEGDWLIRAMKEVLMRGLNEMRTVSQVGSATDALNSNARHLAAIVAGYMPSESLTPATHDGGLRARTPTRGDLMKLIILAIQKHSDESAIKVTNPICLSGCIADALLAAHALPPSKQEESRDKETEAYARFGREIIDQAKLACSGECMGEEHEHQLELAAKLGAGGVRKEAYDPAIHRPIDCEPGDYIWSWAPIAAMQPASPTPAPREFKQEVIGEPTGYFPHFGEFCEYEREPGNWVPCEILDKHGTGERRQYVARYVSATGEVKKGILNPGSLRPTPAQGKEVA